MPPDDARAIHAMLEGLDPKEKSIALVCSIIEANDRVHLQLMGIVAVLEAMAMRMPAAERALIATQLVEVAHELDEDVGALRWN